MHEYQQIFYLYVVNALLRANKLECLSLQAFLAWLAFAGEAKSRRIQRKEFYNIDYKCQCYENIFLCR